MEEGKSTFSNIRGRGRGGMRVDWKEGEGERGKGWRMHGEREYGKRVQRKEVREDIGMVAKGYSLLQG